MKIWVTENNVVHHRKPRSVATVEYVQVSELAESVKVIEWYADHENHKHFGMINDDGFNWSKAHIDEGQRARDFLAKIER